MFADLFFNGTMEQRLLEITGLSEYSIRTASDNSTLLMTFGDTNHISKLSRPVLMNILFAIRNGIGFHLDTRADFPDVPGDDKHFYKIFALKRAFEENLHCKNFIWVDTDTVILDQGDTMLSSMLNVAAYQDLILTDHSDNLNNGVFMIRRSPWSLQFIEDWIAVSKQYHGDFIYSDQGSMYIIMLRHISNWVLESQQHKCHYVDCEKDANIRKTSLHLCMRKYIDCLGFTYNNRAQMGKIAILRQDIPASRFNQWSFGGRNHIYGNWLNDDYYRNGDLLVHSKLLDEFTTRKRVLDTLKRSHLPLMLAMDESSLSSS